MVNRVSTVRNLVQRMKTNKVNIAVNREESSHKIAVIMDAKRVPFEYAYVRFRDSDNTLTTLRKTEQLLAMVNEAHTDQYFANPANRV